MVSKKYKLILALTGLIQTASFAQNTTMSSTDANWVYDSSKISTKMMAQHNEFINYQTPYPPKPRSMWELGFAGGHGIVIGDRTAFTKEAKTGEAQPMYNGGVAGGITIRKAVSHTFSIRGGYWGSYMSIPHYQHFGNGTPQDPPRSEQTSVINQTHMLSLELVTSLNPASPYRGNPKTNLYFFGGYSAMATHLIDGNPDANKGHLLVTQPDNPLNTKNGSFLTFGDFTAPDNSRFGDKNKEWKAYHAVSTGGGFAFKLSDKINLAIEERLTIPMTGVDNLDGKIGGPGNKANDFLAYSLARLNINMGNSATHVQPLWWINPNNYIYNEVATPRHMKLPPVVLPDADGDGITDQFDLEPNTPAGCAVDSHGVTKDTDGDGVPDCKDKEVLTPQSCFPVDADGIGHCPCPNDSCFKGMQMPTACGVSSLPSVTFKSGSATLSTSAKSILNGVAQQLNASPNCNVRVIGYGASDKRAQQLSWDHVNAVIKYLSEQQGVSESRFIFTYGMDGDANTVDLQPTTETGPNTVPAPHPQYQKKS